MIAVQLRGHHDATKHRTKAREADARDHRAVGQRLADRISEWLVAGIAAAIGLLLPKLHDLARLIGDGRTIWVISLLCLAIVTSVFSLLLGAQVAAATTSTTELQNAMECMLQPPVDVVNIEAVFTEARRGLWWPALWGFDYGRRATERGDYVASGRLVARLSQIQGYLIIGQVLLMLVSVLIAAAAAL